MTKKITLILHEGTAIPYIRCPKCGNTEHDEGFLPVNSKGEVVDTYDNTWDNTHYGCEKCNLIIEVLKVKSI